MYNLSKVNAPKKTAASSTKTSKNSKLFKTIINAIQEKKGDAIISLDLRKIDEAVADFFIVCQGNSTTQVKAIADFVEFEVEEKCGEMYYKHEGRAAQQWILIDFVNIVVHVMLPEQRKFYRLEELWSDAPQAEHI
jgi:ribosome-associated protein